MELSIGTQVERDIIDEKRHDGIAAARAKGTGRPRLVNDKLLIEALTLKEAASRCLRSLAD